MEVKGVNPTNKSYSEGNHFAQVAILNILHKICDTSFTLDTQDCPGREGGIVPCG